MTELARVFKSLLFAISLVGGCAFGGYMMGEVMIYVSRHNGDTAAWLILLIPIVLWIWIYHYFYKRKERAQQLQQKPKE